MTAQNDWSLGQRPTPRVRLVTDEDTLALSDVHLDREAFTATLDEQVPISQTVRVDFTHSGVASGTVRLVGRVKAVRFEAGGMHLTLEPRMLHSAAGEACLRDFVRCCLGDQSMTDPGFEVRATGAFFSFCPAPSSRQIAVVRPRAARDAGPPSCDIDLPALCRVSDESYRVTLYRVEKEGRQVYGRSKGPLPPRGALVRVTVPLLDGRHVGRVHLVGVVNWQLAELAAMDGGAFRMLVDEVDDGEEGQLWMRLIRDLGSGPAEKLHRERGAAA